ncbi:phosphoglycerate mutase, putative [Plasmodium knowlesi strain H]|uniref:Phosphoglycerate mutase, putative n=3 Tax=Plasmodium knowlesi TaxID=5850 RepID=A0A5K1UEY3_PLAKH|nr:phosphoglycerate mutase, putative [Plasmodium knowlesi strain H]OTN66083.1 putative Phosphoglycerate mutase [Plasmodium knowlesi]CAA9987965.1 phosphoglycerate mutase, putative [Plasmodium knowlesi strain H]SBO22141.1 phosphoglycerate mutase, putative [Plasmodium knowlesi strain H]VVS77439.1 phosphoglycerate mutase, putative [Plasmodium knowlesi strain H]|eukprot:XP_002258944.1 hypothetical protein, conserved in Plasmodium species [Plasmodium knowlesi strain H]
MKGNHSYERNHPGNWNTNAQAINRKKLNIKNGRINDIYNYNGGVNKFSGPHVNALNDKKKGYVNVEEEDSKGKIPPKNMASYHYVDHGYYDMGNANNMSYGKANYYNQAFIKFPNGKGAVGGYGGSGNYVGSRNVGGISNYAGSGYGGSGYGGSGYGGSGYGGSGYGGNGYGSYGYASYGNYGNHGGNNYGYHGVNGAYDYSGYNYGAYENYEGQANFNSQYDCYENYNGYEGNGYNGYNDYYDSGYNNYGSHHLWNNNNGNAHDAHNEGASNYAHHSYGTPESAQTPNYEFGGAKYHHYDPPHLPHKGNESHVKFNELISDVYYKSSYYLKRNRKYMQNLLKSNCVINIYLVRHMEAMHNREVLDKTDKVRDLIYKDIKYLDCGASEQGKQMCENLKKDGNNRLYQKVMELYNESLKKVDIPSTSGVDISGATNKGSVTPPSNSTPPVDPVGSAKKGILERNNDFIIISSPLRRCLETMKYYFNFKKNILIYESVREMAGNYSSDQRSKTSDVKKFCEQNFEDYEVVCFGENDIFYGDKFRESSDQVYCRCLQFLKMAHSLAVNYFASLERENGEEDDAEEADKREDGTEENQMPGGGNVEKDLCGGMGGPTGEVMEKSCEEGKIKREDHVQQECQENLTGEGLVAEVSTCKKSEQEGKVVDGGEVADGGKVSDEDKNLANEKKSKGKEKKRVYNIVLVSHSSFIMHFLALLDYFDLGARNFNNCEIRKVVIPLSNTFLFFNNVVNMQLAKPVCNNNFPIVFRNKNKILKKAFKDKNIYTLSTYNDFDELTCQHPCTVVIYQYASLVNEEKYMKYLEKVKNFIDLANKEHEQEEKFFSNGMFKNYVKEDKDNMGRSVLVSDASEHILYVKEKNAWEVNKKGFFVGQNVVIIVLPHVEPTVSSNNVNISNNTKEKPTEKSAHLDNVLQVVNNYNHVQDLIKSKDFWKVVKENINNMDLNTFQEYLIGKYTKNVKSEEADNVCYLDLSSCLESKSFMDTFQDRCNGYLKRLKERCDAFPYVDLENECRYINENLLMDMFPREYASGTRGRLAAGSGNRSGDWTNGKEDTTLDQNTLVRKKFMCIPRRAAASAKVAAEALFGHSNKSTTVAVTSGGGDSPVSSKNFLQENINTLKSFPQSIQNLSVEMFYRDHFFYFHCLHRFIKSKNKVEGLIISKLLTFLDLLRAFDVSATNKIFQKLSKLEGLIENNTCLDEEDRLVNTYSCDKKCAQVNNTSYYDESARKYKLLQTLRGRKKKVVDDLNYMRYNLLTVAGGAENVFILNVLK